ncbi:MAG: oxidoreductase [candidate division KSB1 bacterium]|nr:oxidoreductase [candidate division KSB1 bacterium]MDZ7364406.1 oxidoreductase [candidate division KSB1 bacterium]MDZ7402778.1 oxidoreductase [candidate division KSB1 bacterium]
MTKSALLLGASGLVGGHCLKLLLEDEAYAKVTAWVRKPLALCHPKLEQTVVDFTRLESYAERAKANDVFCCLGTTIRKAGSQAAFRQVDFTHPVEIAKIAVANGAGQFLIVTSLGANPKSPIFYNRVKGEVEAAITPLPFHAVHIFRPSLLLGERQEVRPGEKIGAKVAGAFSFLFRGPLRKYRPIHARVVAAAMIAIAKQNLAGVNIFESDWIEEVGGKYGIFLLSV